ncbi:MAG: folylpolyglutamate synthase/dihydropteroate synthase [Oceanicoccus sp.]|jgi:folylpolyglutamate synthase/dihydropteroate synthase
MMLPFELKPILEELGGYDRPSIHVAGSKGKGTTTMLLAHLLKLKGKKVGQFVSPYILDERECIQINGEMITESEMQRLRELMPESLSFFEQRTLIALRYFQEQNCDFVVIEAGWGGEKDATNVIESKVLTILTHIELEHTKTLGHDFTEITRTKLGICRPGVPLLTPPNQELEVNEVINLFGIDVIYCPTVELGIHHPESVGLVWGAMDQLGFTIDETELKELRDLVLPGRFDVIKRGPHTLIMDGAHTHDSVNYVQNLVHEFTRANEMTQLTWAIHFLRDKPSSLSRLFPKGNTIWVPVEDARAGLNPEKFRVERVEELFRELDRLESPQVLVIIGSFKLVAAVKMLLQSE